MVDDEKMKKVRAYRRIKLNFGLEPYLENINDKAIRKCLSSYRISAHRSSSCFEDVQVVWI